MIHRSNDRLSDYESNDSVRSSVDYNKYIIQLPCLLFDNHIVLKILVVKVKINIIGIV